MATRYMRKVTINGRSMPEETFVYVCTLIARPLKTGSLADSTHGDKNTQGFRDRCTAIHTLARLIGVDAATDATL